MNKSESLVDSSAANAVTESSTATDADAAKMAALTRELRRAADAVRNAQVLLVSAGAGMGVDR